MYDIKNVKIKLNILSSDIKIWYDIKSVKIELNILKQTSASIFFKKSTYK